MTYKLPDIIRDVRICIDQNTTDTRLLTDLDQDTLQLDELIRSKIVDAARRVIIEAPAAMLERGHSLGDEGIYWHNNGSGHIILPEDFLRLIVFKMDDWERPCNSVLAEEDSEYQLQHSRFAGVRGTTQAPVVAIVQYPEGLALEFYSCNSTDARIERAQYIPEPCIDSNDGIDISPKCYRDVVYQTTELVLNTIQGNAALQQPQQPQEQPQ